jgi:hypothetical protein
MFNWQEIVKTKMQITNNFQMSIDDNQNFPTALGCLVIENWYLFACLPVGRVIVPWSLVISPVLER